jgi:two-component system sensor histidine kinase CpxA
MRSLFLKIFLWFWGAMILIGVALFLVITTPLPNPLPGPWRESTGNALAAYAAAAANAWEQGGRPRLAAYLESQEQRSDSSLHFFNEQDRELSGRLFAPLDDRRFNRSPRDRLRGNGLPGNRLPGNGPPGNALSDNRLPFERPLDERHSDEEPPPGGRALNDFPPDRFSPDGHPPPDIRPDGPRGDGSPLFGRRTLPLLEPSRRSPPDIQALRHGSRQTDEALFELDGPRVIAAQRVTSGTGQRYVLQAILPRPWFGRPPADPLRQWLGGFVVLAMSGLVCYGLVRYLTAPLVSLRAATTRLAAGDLAARTGAAAHARRDEVADLGRDFDAMAERIEALVVAQRRLLGDISHELRSPLARLSIGLALARRYATSGAATEQIDAAFERTKRETTRLNLLIEQLLQLVRLESDSVTAEHQVIDLEQLLHEIVDDANFEMQGMATPHTDRRVVLVTRCSPCHTSGSAELLRSAVENVVRNALHYADPNTVVEVSLDWERDSNGQASTAVICVRDHGEGVPAEALENLFRPFYRVADARDRESGGVGLGLAITERAVRSHAGTVSAANDPAGGLVVRIRLPASALATTGIFGDGHGADKG